MAQRDPAKLNISCEMGRILLLEPPRDSQPGGYTLQVWVWPGMCLEEGMIVDLPLESWFCASLSAFPSSWSFSREVAIADAALGMNIRGLSVQCH